MPTSPRAEHTVLTEVRSEFEPANHRIRRRVSRFGNPLCRVDVGIDPYANLKNYRFVGADDPVRPAANLYPRNLKFIKIEIYRRLIP